MNIILNIITWIYISLFWLIIVPIGFVSLYSSIELQNAARASTKIDPRLAMLQTTALTEKLDIAEESHSRADELKNQAHQSRVQLFEARNRLRGAAIDVLASQGIKSVSASCMAPADVLKACQVDRDRIACQKDWEFVLGCYDRALGLTKQSSSAYELKNKLEDARNKGIAYNELAERVQDAAATENSTLLPVAEAIRHSILRHPIQIFFSLPQGVVVACFTSLMAALGAGVTGLVGLQKSTPETHANARKSFMVAPLLGGLTGFMVYFVVSAGAAVLVQPAPDSSQPITNLSAPALASLGVFAGLAAERAIAWLQERANAFFKSQA